jgi:outer membrane protein
MTMSRPSPIRSILLAAAAMALLASTAAAQTARLGVFDPQQISDNSDEGKRVQAQLAAFQEQKQTALDEMAKKIDDLRKQLKQQEFSLSAEKRDSMARDIQREMLDLESARDKARREFELEFNQARAGFEEKLLAAVQNYAKEESFAVILERGVVAWADNSVDVTTGILDRFNKMFPVAPAP